jgi:hypothetical protein
MEDWNKAAIMKLIWNLFTQADSLYPLGCNIIHSKALPSEKLKSLRIALGDGGTFLN